MNGLDEFFAKILIRERLFNTKLQCFFFFRKRKLISYDLLDLDNLILGFEFCLVDENVAGLIS